MCVSLCTCVRACLEIHKLTLSGYVLSFYDQITYLKKKIVLANINAEKLSTIVVPAVIKKFSGREWQRYKTLKNDDFFTTNTIA